MIDLIVMLGIFVAGLLLGGFFFGGLLWTIKLGLSAKHPWFWFLMSWFVRTGLVLGVFYLIFDGHWQRLVVCIAGFLISRMVVIRITRLKEQTPVYRKEVENAS